MFRLSAKKALGQELKCKVRLLLPGEELEISYNINSTGQDVLNQVVSELDLLDKDYFGLKLHDQIQWLDLTKTIIKQTKSFTTASSSPSEPIVFELKFKYYPAEPALLANESTRYYLYLQLRLDLIEGRLRSDSQETLAYLIACILQSELGDYTPNPKNTDENYVAEFKFVPNQTEELELASIRLHQNEDFQGLRPVDSELNFLKKACQLDTYGIDPFPVKEGNSHNHFLIGVNHKGISTFQDSKKTNQFSWDEIERITLDSKLVLIYCRKIVGEKKATGGGDGTIRSSKTGSGKSQRALFGFRCPSQEYAHNFWKISTEHRFFFTLESTPELPIVTNTGGLFKKNHKLKYIGRVEKDLLRDHVDENRSNGVKRSHSLMSKSFDGPRWQGFQPGKNLQSSLKNIYSSDLHNKTMPSNLNYFREEEEEELEAANRDAEECDSNATSQNYRQGFSVFQTDAAGRKRLSTDSAAATAAANKDTPKTFTRRSVLTTKNESANNNNNNNAIRRDSQIYLDTDHKTQDFIKTTIFLMMLIIAFIITMLLINDSDRPNSVSMIIKRMNLERVSTTLRQNYYLPLKSALGGTVTQVLSILDARII